MKATSETISPPPPKFNPVKISITFESQQELDTFGALFNYSHVCDLFDNEINGTWPGVIIRKAVTAQGGDCNKEFVRVKNFLRSK